MISHISRKPTRLLALRAANACALSLCATWAFAQAPYPTKPINVVIGYPPGGSVDAVGRTVIEGMGKRLGATTVIDNVGGAAGAIGVQKSATAAADGYNLVFGSSSEFVAVKAINPSIKYDVQRDFVPVGFVGSIPLVLVASRQSGVTSLNKFVAEVKAKPGKFSYGTSGVGSMLHFSGELLKRQAGISILHIPYRGASNIGADLAGGSIEFAFLGPGAARPFIEAGHITPIAVTSAKRTASLPDVPALGEHPALKGYDLVAWYALMAPKGTSAEIVTRLQGALVQSLQDPEVRSKLERIGVDVGRGDEDLPKLMARDALQYQRIVQFAGMKE